MSDDSYLFSANGDIHKLALNDKCVQTDFTEKKNYTIVQFKAYQIRHGKASLKCEVSSKPTGSSQPKKVEKKKHPCSLCDKVFSRSDTLKKHVRTSHSGVAYPQPVAFEASCSSNQHGSQAKIEVSSTLGPPNEAIYLIYLFTLHYRLSGCSIIMLAVSRKYAISPI